MSPDPDEQFAFHYEILHGSGASRRRRAHGRGTPRAPSSSSCGGCCRRGCRHGCPGAGAPVPPSLFSKRLDGNSALARSACCMRMLRVASGRLLGRLHFFSFFFLFFAEAALLMCVHPCIFFFLRFFFLVRM